MAAWRDPDRAQGLAFYVAWLLYVAALLGLLGMILWKLWTAVAAGLAL